MPAPEVREGEVADQRAGQVINDPHACNTLCRHEHRSIQRRHFWGHCDDLRAHTQPLLRAHVHTAAHARHTPCQLEMHQDIMPLLQQTAVRKLPCSLAASSREWRRWSNRQQLPCGPPNPAPLRSCCPACPAMPGSRTGTWDTMHQVSHSCRNLSLQGTPEAHLTAQVLRRELHMGTRGGSCQRAGTARAWPRRTG